MLVDSYEIISLMQLIIMKMPLQYLSPLLPSLLKVPHITYAHTHPAHTNILHTHTICTHTHILHTHKSYTHEHSTHTNILHTHTHPAYTHTPIESYLYLVASYINTVSYITTVTWCSVSLHHLNGLRILCSH